MRRTDRDEEHPWDRPESGRGDDSRLALVTGASTGIGRALAFELADRGCDLVIAADEASIHQVAVDLRARAVVVEPVEVDLATREGVERLAEAAIAVGRPLEVIALNAGIGVAGPFVDTDLDDHLRLLELNVVGTVHLARLLVPAMVERGAGKVLITSSIAADFVGPWMSTYNASKAFLAAFAASLRSELEGTGVTVTALRPGGTDTDFFRRARMERSRLGQHDNDDPAVVARDGVEALLAGEAEVIAGSKLNRLLVAGSKVVPDRVVAALHKRLVDPRSSTEGGISGPPSPRS